MGSSKLFTKTIENISVIERFEKVIKLFNNVTLVAAFQIELFYVSLSKDSSHPNEKSKLLGKKSEVRKIFFFLIAGITGFVERQSFFDLKIMVCSYCISSISKISGLFIFKKVFLIKSKVPSALTPRSPIFCGIGWFSHTAFTEA